MVNNFIGNGNSNSDKCGAIEDATFNIAARTSTTAFDSIRTAVNDLEFQRSSNPNVQTS
jgi:hypothetical protein